VFVKVLFHKWWHPYPTVGSTLYAITSFAVQKSSSKSYATFVSICN